MSADFTSFSNKFSAEILSRQFSHKLSADKITTRKQSADCINGCIEQEFYPRRGFFFDPPQILGNSRHQNVFYIFEATTHPICVQMASKCDKMFILLNRAKTILIVCLFPKNMFVFLVQESSRFVHFCCFCNVLD